MVISKKVITIKAISPKLSKAYRGETDFCELSSGLLILKKRARAATQKIRITGIVVNTAHKPGKWTLSVLTQNMERLAYNKYNAPNIGIIGSIVYKLFFMFSFM
ncbi:MAG: hypothetical protein OCD02_07535 [Spirochaetaceae bacterium]